MCSDLTQHPEYVRLKQIGYEDDDLLHVTILVYIDLIESKGWHNIKLHPVPGLRRTVIVGRASAMSDASGSSGVSVVLPSTADCSLSMQQIIGWMRVVEEIFDTSRLLVAFVDADSTLVYYSLTDGLVAPPPADVNQSEKAYQKYKIKNENRTVNFVTIPRTDLQCSDKLHE